MQTEAINVVILWSFPAINCVPARGAPSNGENFPERLVQKVVGGNNIAGFEHITAAGQVGDEAAGFTDEDDSGRHVP